VTDKEIRPGIPGRKPRGKAAGHDRRRHCRRNRIGTMPGHTKEWRRIATRSDRCAKTFLSAIALAATVVFRLLRSMRQEPKKPGA
jgi:transposase